jgi:hypothetical protein
VFARTGDSKVDVLLEDLAAVVFDLLVCNCHGPPVSDLISLFVQPGLNRVQLLITTCQVFWHRAGMHWCWPVSAFIAALSAV